MQPLAVEAQHTLLGLRALEHVADQRGEFCVLRDVGRLDPVEELVGRRCSPEQERDLGERLPFGELVGGVHSLGAVAAVAFGVETAVGARVGDEATDQHRESIDVRRNRLRIKGLEVVDFCLAQRTAEGLSSVIRNDSRKALVVCQRRHVGAGAANRDEASVDDRVFRNFGGQRDRDAEDRVDVVLR